MKRFTLLLLLSVLVASARVHVQSPSLDPSGAYRCDGVSPDGKQYLAAVHIERTGDTFIVQWLTPRGVASIGVGVLDGNTLAVGYVGTTAGVAVYKLNDKQQLTGEWTDLEAKGQVYRETLTKLRDGEKIVMPKGGGPVF